MGNVPSEANMGDRLRCYKCNCVLPPCTTFDNLDQTYIHGMHVHVFNGGEYFREVGRDNMYQCKDCFYQPIRDQERRQEEEKRRQEEERRRQEEERRRQEEERRRLEEERKRQEEERRRQEEDRQRREAEEKRRRDELDQRLQDSLREAEEQREQQFSRTISEELQSKREIRRTNLDEFEVDDDLSNNEDELLHILSSRCNISVQNLSLSELTAEDLRSILSVLDTLLFDEWIDAPPSLSTLQHTQVFLTELCALSVALSEEVSLQNISTHVQQLVVSIGQSASNVFESFLLSQALYLTLMHFFTEYGESDVDAVLIAKQWAEDELSADQVFVIEFLSSLISSLQSAVGRATVFILKMEIKSLKLLLSTLTNSVKKTHSKCTKMLLGLVETNQWCPMEVVTLLRVLSQKYAEEDSICKVLTLVQVYDLSPEWTDESGRSLLQALDSTDPERFGEDLQKTLRGTDESSLSAALAELKMLWDLDDSNLDLIKNITTGVLHSLENTSEDAPLTKDFIRGVTLDAEDVQHSLFLLCKAVFHTKGWWPTVRTMLRWCALVLAEESAAFEPLGLEADPCVTAMFSAKRVLMGNKMDIVLSFDGRPEKRAEEWSDFYKHLGISVSTSKKKTDASVMNIYEADVVYGTADAFFSDYIQHGLELMETENPQQSRGFVFEGRSLTFSKNLDLSGLKGNDSLVFAAKVLQSIVDKFHSDDRKGRHRLMKALFLMLHTNLNKEATPDTKILSVFEKITGKQPPSTEVFILTFLERLLKEVTDKRESEKHLKSSAGKWCLEILFDYVQKFEPSTAVKDLLQIVSDLTAQRLWSPVEGLSLLKALTDHHHDKECINMLKILHLMTTYQVSSQWTDENNQPLLNLLGSCKSKDVIQHLEKSLQSEKIKSTDALFEEIRQMKDIDEQTLDKSYAVVTHVRNLINTGEIERHTDVQRAKSLSNSKETQDLQEVLAVLCNAVYRVNSPPYKDGKGWWPRDTQMISWCLLALSDTGKLLEMGTGEGKSCAIAMFAALHVMRGEKVDVVSSSSVLCQRDAEEWRNFFELLGMTVDANTNKTEDEDRKTCYQRDVVYGTIEAFAADHLRQIFEMKDVRPERRYQCIIIDEVDSLLLDQGVQLTYLSSPMVSMEHLNTVLAMIWGCVSQYGFLSAEHQTFVQSPPASFFKAIFDSIETEGSEIKDPIDILRIAEETNTVKKGLTEEMLNSNKDELLEKLKTVRQDAMVNFFQEIEDYVPYGFTVYTLDDKGLLCLKKRSPYNNQDVPELKFLVLDEGLCCTLYDSEDDLIKPIAQLISQKVQYTPCSDVKDKISIPGFLKSLVEKKVPVWVQNAFLAVQLQEGREYVVQDDSICPVDFRSTGIIELNKKWGDGLQQFVELKHKTQLSTISIVTNYVSNISFFEMYRGKIYGTTGTLGTKADIQFLKTLYPTLSACKMPTFNRRKLFEVKGSLTTSAEEWKSEIKRVVMDQISSNSHREGRAALVICETINKAKAIYEALKSSVPGETILYCRSDHNSLSKIEKELLPGDVIVATNLAGRGTDIKVSKAVNRNGGLFVVLSFLSENARVELQAFGRTARKGKPGSAQIIMSTEHLPPSFRAVSSLEEAKSTRDRLSAENTQQMMKDIAELRLREELFSEYCKTLQEIHANTDGDEKRAVVAIMNEFWGVWLLIKSEDIDNLKRNELQESLKADLLVAKSQCQSQTSPCSSIYHYIKFGNIAVGEKKWADSSRLFEKAIQQDQSWAAIAFYSRAYCIIKDRKEDYLTKAIDDLRKAQETLKYLIEESIVVLQVVKMSSPTKSEQTSLEKQFLTKQKMYMCFDKNITEAISKLEEIKGKERNAIAKKSPISSLVTSSEEAFQVEADNLFRRGLHYVFAVEEEPRFPWEALLVFLLGALQIIGGALLTAFTFGTFAQVGMGLITEGISDCIYAVESMVTGEFSWKSWAIEKAISIGISLIGFGIGKLIAKGFTACKSALKAAGKQLKSMPKFLTRQAKDGLSAVAKTNMKNAVKQTAKKMAEEIITYGLQKGEEELLKLILQGIENKVEEGINDDVKSKIETKELGSLIDSIILLHADDGEQLQDLLKDQERKTKLLSIFTELSNSAIQPFYADLSLQNKLNSSIYKVIERAKAEVKGKAKTILTIIQAVHMGTLATESIAALQSLSSKFYTNFQEQLSSFKEKQDSQRKEKGKSLPPPDTELLKGFKQELAGIISHLLAAALVEVFHQKFSSHMVSIAQSKAHQVISGLVRTGLKSDRTDELLRAGQESSYIAHMPVSKQRPKGEVSEQSTSYAKKIKDPMTPGTLLDARVMSETTSTKVVILTEDSHGRLTKMQTLSPSTNPASQTVTLIYRPKSEQHPDGHFDVLINNKIVKIDNKDKNCLFHAMARGMKPDASEAEIIEKAGSLRRMEADALLRHPGQWEPFIRSKELIQSIRGGDWFMAEGAKPPKITDDSVELLKAEVGKVVKYKDWINYRNQNPGIGQFINGDHQPPVSCILNARAVNQNSKLAKAMLEVGTNSSPLDINLIPNVKDRHGLELPTVYVPHDVHREFPSTTSPAFRQLLANTIASDDVVGTFKLTIIGSKVRSSLVTSGNYESFQNTPESKSRLSVFEASFQQHSKRLVQTWYDELERKGVMTNNDLDTIKAWIDKKGYNDQNDPHRNQVSSLLQQKDRKRRRQSGENV